MADIETKKIITIDASEGIRTLRQLQQAIENSKEAIQGLDKSSDDYQKGLVQLKSLQGDYNAQMRLSVKESKAVAGSYDALTVELAKLKQQWKATGDEAERSRLTKEVNRVKAQLDTMDHSIGNWQRNVGNYWNSIKGGIAGATAAIVGAIALFRKAGDTFVKVANSTQGTGDALARQVAGWKSGWDYFMRSVAASDFSGFVKGAAEAVAAGRHLATVLDELFERGNSLTLQRAKASEQMAEWEATFRDTTLGDEERLTALNSYINKLKGFQKQETESLQRERDARLDQLAAQAKVTDANKEAFAANIENYNINETLIKQAGKYNALLQTRKNLEAANYGQYEDERKRQIAQVDEQLAMFTSAETAYADFVRSYSLTNDELVKDFVDAQKRLYESGAAVYNENRRLFTLRAQLQGKTAEADDQATAKAVANVQARIDAMNKELAAYVDMLEKEQAAELEASLKAEQSGFARSRSRNASTLAGVGTWESRQGAAARAEIDDERELQTRLYEIRQQGQQKRLELLQRFAKQAQESGDLQGQLDYEQQAADLSVQITQDEVTRKAQLRRQELADIRNNVTAAVEATQQILGNIASAYQATIDARVRSGEISEQEAAKEYERIKALQIAQTWINALAGSVAIWANTDPSPYWVKAVQSAAILTQGIAATAQIQATQRGSATSNAFAAVQAAPVVLNAPGQIRTITSASDEERLNAQRMNQRVVLVYSDVEAAAKRVEVTNQESSF